MPKTSSPAERPVDSDRPVSSVSPRRPLVLLVEDHVPNVMVARAFLENFGYDIEVVTNGRDAVDRLTTRLYDAVLMDVQMQGMNGYEATQAVRDHEAATGRMRQPIIGMTAHALMGDRERCLEAGMDDYISKPFVPEELRHKLEAYIHARSTA